ncbi:NHLP bacteriocin system secretion protein [Sphingopyxis sp. XHP0097]|uniref:NHLP bacteriocin system secretion protein n=1 Tax=Sphingopyxis jiangsuensis TaxID=2871171 RepID=A0ABS7MI30_9SPHN|nr:MULTISPECIES: NHLP bacteriocin system secretion protein [Sphingopyxis]MBL0768536.1 NHLP bacteriocin system secretion protein [Sphingopyxis lutea]MBY4638374.1 NHLP bacteriocin system secretion protein [Sphingopyxis jiangsuensis]
MSETIYRQSALDRMASPERLDAPLTLVSRPSWILLGAFAVALVAALVWASVTRAPVTVGASGILINRAGLAEIAAAQDGRIQSLLVIPGDTVRVGQPVATIARTELARELADARSNLRDAEARLQRLRLFFSEQGARESGADGARLRTIAQTRRALESRAAYLEKRAGRMEALIERGFITQDQLVDVQIELAAVREQLSNLGEAALRVRIDANARSGTSGLALLDEQREVDSQLRLIRRLEARLGDEEVVRATVAGRVTEVKVGTGDVIAPGTALATVAPDQGGLVALLYVPAGEGKRITVGMAAEITPTAVERAIYGHIPGRVTSVAPLPATPEGMRRVLRNDQLVAQLTAAGAPIEVRVALEGNAANPSGFAWSASKGPPGQIGAGSIVGGRVIVADRRIIGLLVPGAGE